MNTVAVTIPPFNIALPEEGSNSVYWPPIKEYRPRRACLRNAGVGVNDLYTCPENKRAFVGYISAFNPTNGAIVISPFVRIGDTPYRVRNDWSAPAGARAAAGGANLTYCLEPSDILTVITSAAGLNLWAMIVEYDESVPVRTARLLNMETGDNPLYRVPDGKCASVFYTQQWFNQTTAVYYSNESGGSRVVTCHLVPDGATAGPDTQHQQSIIFANNTVGGGFFFDSHLEEGDSIVIAISDGMGQQSAYATIIEFDIVA